MRRTQAHPTRFEMPVLFGVTDPETLSSSWNLLIHAAGCGGSQLSSKQSKTSGASYAPSSRASLLECMPQSATTPAEYQTITSAREQPILAVTALDEISNLANELLSWFVGRMQAHVVIPCEQHEHPDAQPYNPTEHLEISIVSSLWRLTYSE
jgi:hypothetical protein